MIDADPSLFELALNGDAFRLRQASAGPLRPRGRLCASLAVTRALRCLQLNHSPARPCPQTLINLTDNGAPFAPSCLSPASLQGVAN